MASITYSASTLKTSASDSAWRTDTSNAYQGMWTEPNTYNNKRIGYIGFSSSMGTTMASSSISEITISMTATASGMGYSSTKTIYFYKYDSSGSTPSGCLGSQLGSFSGSGFYSNTKTITCNSSTNSSLFNALKSYLEAGNTALMIYAPNDTTNVSGYYCSTNYVGFSAVSLAITYTSKYTLTLTKGTGISSVSGGGSYASGSSVTATATPSTGYNFTKWTNSSGTSVSTSSSYTFTLSADTTLTANASLKTYTISYNANSGSGAPSNQTKTYGVDLTLSTTAPTRTGYTFLGWSTSSSATTASYSAGGTFTSNATTTLYAVWQANVYTITLNNESATSAGTTAYYQKYNVGLYKESSCSTAITTITVPTRTGYTFGGYYTETGGGGTQYINASGTISATKTTFTANTTLYAKWTANTYTVTYNANGGSGTMTASTATYGSGFKTTQNAFTRTGHTFIGWNEKQDGSGTTWDKSTSGTYENGTDWTWTYTNNITLYAIWEQYSYTITYNPGEGTGTATTSSHAYNDSSKLTDISTLGFSLSGYNFNGWATSSGGAVVYTNGATAPYTLVTSDGSNINLYAIYTQNSPWTLTQIKLYDATNGKWWTI